MVVCWGGASPPGGLKLIGGGETRGADFGGVPLCYGGGHYGRKKVSPATKWDTNGHVNSTAYYETPSHPWPKRKHDNILSAVKKDITRTRISGMARTSPLYIFQISSPKSRTQSSHSLSECRLRSSVAASILNIPS
jgi:hypothetical protein